MERLPKSTKIASTTTLTANKALISYAMEAPVNFDIELTSHAVKRILKE